MKKNRRVSIFMTSVLQIFLLLGLVAGCGNDSGSNTQSSTDSSQSTTEETETPAAYVASGFPQVVVVSGTNYEMGVQYGKQAASAIYHNLIIFKSKLYTALGSETVTEDMQVWDYFLMQYDPTLKDWLDGIRQGCYEMGFNVSYADLILLMVYPTELWSRPGDYPPEWGERSQAADVSEAAASSTTYHSCNTFAADGAATSDGKPIHAITQMAGTEMMNNIILIAFPEDGYSFISQTYAGRVNANSAMNSNGFCWTMTAILSDEPVWGLTEVYFHYLAQLAGSPADAVEYLQNTPRGGVAGGFILTNASGIQVFETHADVYSQRTPSENGFVVQTNHLVDPELEAYNPFWLQFIGTYERYNTVYQFLTEAPAGSVNFEFAKSVLASSDWYDSEAGEWHYNEPGSSFISNDHTSVSQSIFFPANLIAYLQTGTPSGTGIPSYATGEYVKIKLATDPKTVTMQADDDALSYYWEAADLFEYEINAAPAYLTTEVIADVRGKLDEAMTAYSYGIDREAYSDLETNGGASAMLWGSALTYFAKAQLYAQMAKTALQEAQAQAR
jgi:hypothetical protein